MSALRERADAWERLATNGGIESADWRINVAYELRGFANAIERGAHEPEGGSVMEILKPSEVRIGDPFPFVGVFGKAEVEAAVAAVVLASTLRDSWEPVTMVDLRAVLVQRGDAPPPWLLNPFLNLGLGIRLAVERGLLERTDVPGGADTIQVLPAALDLIAKREEVAGA